jgi:hypothetical protein
MARDEDNFFCFRTWEILFPAIIQKKALSLVGRFDRLIGHIFSKLIRRIETALLGDFLKSHSTGLYYPEEDELLLIHIFSSVFLFALFPFLEELRRFSRFDEALRPGEQKRIMNFYRNCLKRQAYFNGKGKNLLSKNPAFSAKVKNLYEYFPGCKIIYMIRNPLDVVPSMQSQIHATCTYQIPHNSSGYFFKDGVYDVAKYYYRYPLEQLEQAPLPSHMIVNFLSLVSQLKRTVELIYAHFGIEIGPEYLRILKEEETKAKRYKSKHVYSLEQFNFTREQILSDLHEIFTRFGFDPRGENPQDS